MESVEFISSAFSLVVNKVFNEKGCQIVNSQCECDHFLPFFRFIYANSHCFYSNVRQIELALFYI
jgi:hypothetical protein